MATIINRSGSVNELLKRVDDPSISSMDDIYTLLNNIDKKIAEEKEKEESRVKNETNRLENQIKDLREGKKDIVKNYEKNKEELEEKISALNDKDKNKHSFEEAFLKVIKIFRKVQLFLLVQNYKYIEVDKIRKMEKGISKKQERYQYLIKNKSEIIKKGLQKRIEELKRARKRVKHNHSYFLGAKGELRVIKELEKLPDNYIVINDYKKRFSNAIYRKKKGDYIKTIQVDHIVIGPTGIFVIETKNWSKDSLRNKDYYSPIDQVERFGHALFVLINKKTFYLKLSNEGWKKNKVRVKNLIAVKNKPQNINLKYNPFVYWGGLVNRITYGDRQLSTKEIGILTRMLGVKKRKTEKSNLDVSVKDKSVKLDLSRKISGLLLSFLFPGLGHLFIKKKKKGFLLLFLSFLSIIFIVTIPFYFVLLMYAIYDSCAVIGLKKPVNFEIRNTNYEYEKN